MTFTSCHSRVPDCLQALQIHSCATALLVELDVVSQAAFAGKHTFAIDCFADSASDVASIAIRHEAVFKSNSFSFGSFGSLSRAS